MSLTLPDLLVLILQANTTDVLCRLKEAEANLDRQLFQQLLLGLTEDLTSVKWADQVDDEEQRLLRQKRNPINRTKPTLKIEDIRRCSHVVLNYVITLISGKQDAHSEAIWTAIFRSSLAKQISFYRFLYRENVLIPESILAQHGEELLVTDKHLALEDVAKLLLLGVSFLRMHAYTLSVKKCERLFSILHRSNSYPRKVQAKQLVEGMKTPAHISLFLSYFRDYDVNTIYEEESEYLSKRLTLFDKVLAMELHSPERLVNLIKALVLRGARLSAPLQSNQRDYYSRTESFFDTTLGLYVLLGLRMGDINPCPEEGEMEFILRVLDYIEQLPPGLRPCLLQRLSLSYSIMRSPTISLPQRARGCVARPLRLKDCCRLTIKDACPQRYVDRLNLCRPLKEYVTFGLLHPKFASNCIAELSRHTPSNGS